MDRLRRRRTAPPAGLVAVTDTVATPPGVKEGEEISVPSSAVTVLPSSAVTVDPPLVRAGWRRVLLVSDDRRFRALASTLLSQRGYSVSVGLRGEDVAALAVREAADVVVIDASSSLTAAAHEAARLACLTPPVGIVAVSADSHAGLATLPVVPKWSPFEALFDAIERACEDVARDEVTNGPS